MQVLRPVTPTESKAIKSSLITQGVKCRVQVKNGTMYIYHPDVVGSFTAQEKSIIRDELVLGGFVSICGEAYTNPKTRISSGSAIRKP